MKINLLFQFCGKLTILHFYLFCGKNPHKPCFKDLVFIGNIPPTSFNPALVDSRKQKWRS